MKDCKTRPMFMALIGILLFFLIVAVFMWVWNKVVPWVIGFPPITYWQAAGLIIISRILIGRLSIAGRLAFMSLCSCDSKEKSE